MNRKAAAVGLVVVMCAALATANTGSADALLTPTIVALEPGGKSGIGLPVFMTALLEGGQQPTGTVTFEVFAAADSACAGPPIATATVPVNGDDYYSSGAGGEFEPAIVIDSIGRFPGRIRYSGDSSNAPASTACGQPAVEIAGVPTLVVGTAEPPIVGRAVRLTASLVGGVEPTGLVNFLVFADTDEGCEEEPLVATEGELSSQRALAPQTFTPARAGSYPINVYYSGDARNVSAFLACGESAARLEVTRAQPTISATPSTAAVVGEAISVTAVLSGGYIPKGSITFNLYGPLDATCTGQPDVALSVPLDRGRAGSSGLAADEVGRYRFTARYGGDANNAPAESACGEASTFVAKARPSLAVSDRPEGGGRDLSATAVLSGAFDASGTVTFTVFGPHAAACSGSQIFRVIAPVIGGAATSGTFTTGGAGRFAVLATYSGDPRNEAANGACQALELADYRTVGGGIEVHVGAHASRVRARVHCERRAASHCVGVITLTVSERLRSGRVVGVEATPTARRKVVVGRARYTVRAGRTHATLVAINALGRGLARKFGGLPVRLTLHQIAPGGSPARIEP
jgi:hypothetical protein